MLLLSLRVRIFAFLPEALNSAPVREAFWAKSLVPAEGNTALATVIKLPAMNERREQLRILWLIVRPDGSKPGASPLGADCRLQVGGSGRIPEEPAQKPGFDHVPVP